MAQPTAPTLDTLTVEALKQTGRTSATAGDTLQTRSETWIEELFSEIWGLGKGKFKTLQRDNIFVITEGIGRIANPTDFANHITLELLSCTHYGVCQAGGNTTTAILASTEDMSSTDPIGKEVVIYLTSTKTTTYSSFVSGFNTTTKTLTFSPAISVSPDTTYSYMIVDSVKPIEQGSITQFGKEYKSYETGTPIEYYPYGDADDGEYLLYPIPYFNDSIPRAIRHRYYVNLLKLDRTEGSGYLFTTILQKWRSCLTTGIKAKCFQNDNDDRALVEWDMFMKQARTLASRETYGYDLSNLTRKVKS